MTASQHSTSPRPLPPGQQSGIYVIRCKPTGKIYVGSAVRIGERWRQHRRVLATGKHHSVLLQRAWDKYGPDAFVFMILENCLPEQLLSREQHYMDTMRSYEPAFGFNINKSAWSRLGRPHSPETVEKMAAAFRGRPLSEETKAKMSEAHRGKVKSAEHRSNLSKAHQGKKLSDEHRRKSIETRRLRYLDPENRRNLAESHAVFTREQIEQIVALIAEGKTLKVIAQRFGCMKSVVSNIKNGMTYVHWSGLPRKQSKAHSRLTREQVEQVVAMIAEGKKYSIIAQQFGCSIMTICDIKYGRRHARYTGLPRIPHSSRPRKRSDPSTR